MTFTCRELQCADNKGIFHLEFARQSHTHRTLNKVKKNAVGPQCQKI
ncbi:hypothetical protein SAMN06265380_101472 [Ruegeria faecimaris]|uniref:Uncharacterized protein n=1 Tax=Ruegeria faecimaris TaxID=686389 RepID=A0A521B0K0_9RHOB|nr:hypothetical protein SAMN06265380_101472 [Ruegeria faecimaris]